MRRLVPPQRVLLATMSWQQQRRWEFCRDKAADGEGASASASSPRRRKMSPAAAELSRSEDVSKREERLDIERHFPTAMSHIKAPLVSSYVVDEGRKRKWKEATCVVNADGYAPAKEDTDAAASFFNEGSLDIRGGPQKRGTRERVPSRRESASPDVLQLSAGNARQHGLALAEESNVSPADPTIEPEGEEGQGASGDTPVQLTDMLKERLMELKAEKLREDRNDTYLPRRLRLLSDHEVEKQLEEKTTQRKLAVKIRSAASNLTSTTLADLDNEDIGRGEKGVDQLMRAADATNNTVAMGTIFRRSADFIPGETSYDPLADFAKESLNIGMDRPSTLSGSVHLLRCLPRSGFCSRREALAIIASGQVRVDNVVERNPFRLVRAENNIHIESHSGRLRFAPPRLWMYHKPAYVIVSRNDVAGRTLITKHARILGMDHLVPVGSLPMRSHGLLLLTNDGELSRLLENPKTMIQQTYLLRVRPAIDPVLAHKLNTEGILVNGKRHGNVEFFVNPAMKSRYSLKVKVRGETMPISHLMQHLGRTVERGGRISFGPFSMSGLPVGSIREVTIPPYYMRHTGAVWKEFIERDWPFFRRQRVSRLRRLSRYRELTPKELEELDNFTYEEIKDALSFESQELKAASEEQLQRMSIRPTLDEQPLQNDFGGVDVDSNCALPEEDEIMEDITAVI
ncbi:putative tRNA pseudouridine synthase A [Trypanosoma rangeli]|uniref:Putative tRNA pseudouridine synthase A n=1 Tax=Trypanosoma rangeli TaxID=5698 RepID=A0A3R7R867_TRYRA|nr:putative tRNA pseudouridine synthase A [Trypanosoma rangeli]RNE97637.1 putative tRNA pseudouridine synthase A [Trypanosoma rangeli]|eukprot:RNE97637.1 putative tRNA pseudouridine synthase A [Trypanosoma rangeli]